MKKLAFVTGISSGIGFHAFTRLTNLGYHVIGTVRNEKDREVIQNQFPTNTILTFDVRDIEEMTKELEKTYPILAKNGLSVLINNAGFAVAGPLQYISESDFEAQLDVNVKAVRRITNALLPFLGVNKQYNPGKIINISSISGLFTSPFNAAYSISKYALEAMSDGYRRELSPFGIQVSIIEPGPIKTEIWRKNLGTLTQYSGTEYAELLKNADRIIENAEKHALSVSVISDVIQKIVQSEKPKTRYLVHSKPYMFRVFTKWFSDKMQDRMVANTMSKGDKHRPM